MIVELHMIQNFAPSNLNRDEANTPKDCRFGGYRRARISSQCIKRSVRQHGAFRKAIQAAEGNLAIRTKRIIGKLADIFIEKHGKSREDSNALAERAIMLFGIKRDDKRQDKTSVLLYLGENELNDLANIAVSSWKLISEIESSVDENEDESTAKKARKKKKAAPKLTKEQSAVQKELQKVVSDDRLKNGSYAADIALFGRMVADKSLKNMNVNAACQVAHAISTHKVEMEMDYFTAVDDLLPEEDSGSDMIGIVEFNSSCFYRYSAIDLNILNKNLGFNRDLAAATVRGYVEASVKAVPTGKQNSMSAQNPPGYVRVLVRKNGFPWSLANAFQKPIFQSQDQNLEESSIVALDNYLRRLKNIYGKDSIVCDTALNIYGENTGSLEGILECIDKTLSEEAPE
jgi:CRISPR system Cascade subunit CasC